MTEKDYTTIQAYLTGTLSEEENRVFSARLANEPALQEELNWQKENSAFLKRETMRSQLQASFAQVESDFFEAEPIEKKTTKFRLLRFSLISAAAAAVLLFFYINFLSSPDLYEKYSQPTALSLSSRSSTTSSAQQAENAFNQKDYAKAYIALGEYLIAEPEDTRALLYRGIAATETAQYEEAEQIFTQIIAGTSQLKTGGIWYLSLMYLKKGDKEKAMSNLANIPEGDYWHSYAEKLLAELNNI